MTTLAAFSRGRSDLSHTRDAGGPSHDKSGFCYAGKEHPELEQSDLVFTYVCNTLDVPELVTRHDIYHPQVITTVMPDSARR